MSRTTSIGQDTQHQRCRFSKLAGGFAANDFLHKEVRERLFDRLPLFRHEPKYAIDLGGGVGDGAYRLSKAYPLCKVLNVDSAFGMTLVSQNRLGKNASDESPRSVCAEAAQLPFADNSLDLVTSNMMLHYTENLAAVLQEVSRVLKPGGLFLFSLAGNGSLNELKSAWAEIVGSPAFSPLPELQPVGDALLKTGFSGPVLDSEVITITYRSADTLLQELRQITVPRLHSTRRKGLTGKDLWSRMRAACESGRNADGVIPVSVEVIYGHAWSNAKAGIVNVSGNDDSEVGVPLSTLLGRKPRKMSDD